MTGSRYLLDTNAVIRLLESGRTSQEPFLHDAEVFLSVTVIGELHFGAMKSSRVDENVAQIERLIRRRVVLSCDLGTACQYGMIKMELRQKGRPIPDNDLWIAATARQHGLTLVSRDQHFGYVDGLTIERW
jgi:tRNA(fMet)-specific endonuclease VapC